MRFFDFSCYTTIALFGRTKLVTPALAINESIRIVRAFGADSEEIVCVDESGKTLNVRQHQKMDNCTGVTVKVPGKAKGKWRLFFWYNADPPSIYLGLEETSLEVAVGYLRDLACIFGGPLDIRYGYIKTATFRSGPEWDAFGVHYGFRWETFLPFAKDDGRTRWFRELNGAKRHLVDHVRDVYPANVLSQTHLMRKIAGETLRNWIHRNSFGEISEIGEKLCVWSLKPELIDKVRNIFLKEGALI
jgi:hypothetical protein